MLVAVSNTTKEVLQVPVTEDGSVPNDSFGVHIAFLPVGLKEEPEGADWLNASWDDAGNAQIMIGPDTTAELANGYYDIWVRVTTPTEVPVRRAGRIRIT